MSSFLDPRSAMGLQSKIGLKFFGALDAAHQVALAIRCI